MKIFNQVPPFDSKVNFVDENNVVVGYDIEQDCCEFASWFILKEKATKDNLDYDWMYDQTDNQLEFDELEYRFDINFRETISRDDLCDYTTVTIFRLVSIKDGPDLYLHLHNSHNGYYSHGFTVTVDDKEIEHGSL